MTKSETEALGLLESLDYSQARRRAAYDDLSNGSGFFRVAYATQPDPGRINTEPSSTVPDQTMSIKELLARHARGLPLDGHYRIPVYHGEQFIPDIANMDLADIANMDLAERAEFAKAVKDFIRENTKRPASDSPSSSEAPAKTEADSTSAPVLATT